MTTSLLVPRRPGTRRDRDDGCRESSLLAGADRLLVPWTTPPPRRAGDADDAPAGPAPDGADAPVRPREGAVELAGPTLDDAITRAWEGLVVGLPGGCPVCHRALASVAGDAVAGHCDSCGVTLD